MTKQDYIDELRKAKAEAEDEGDGNPFYKGEAIALGYAIDLAKDIRIHVPYIYSRNVNLSLTMEQAKYLSSLLGDGALDRLIRGKITRKINDLWK